MDTLCRDHLLPCLAEFNASSTIYIGFSGGLDSTVLLHAVSSLVPASKLKALHINHHLSPNSESWQQFCQDFADACGVRFLAESVQVNATGYGLEQAAREQRYQVFLRHMTEDSLLLLAHHLDDQVETVFYRLLRGAGPKGLAGMPRERPLGEGRLLRPLLGVTRQKIENYARRHKLTWVDDESNRSPEFDRNYLRNEVLPHIAQRWPDFRQRIKRSAGQNQSAQQVLEEVAVLDLQTLNEEPCRDGWRLTLPGFLSLSVPRQANLLRYWSQTRGLPIPGYSVITQALRQVAEAAEDANPEVTWEGGVFRRYRDYLYLCQPAPQLPDTTALQPWDLNEPFFVGNSLVLTARLTDKPGLCLKSGDRVEVGFRRGGERCKPLGRNHSAPLKKILQEYGVEPWLRALVPLVYVNGELAALAGYFVCDGFSGISGDRCYQLDWNIN